MRISDWSSDVCSSDLYGKHYTIAWPSEEHDSGRPCRRSPLYAILKEQGACFGEKLGWERPNWYADADRGEVARSEEHTSELQSLMRISYAVFCLTKKTKCT